MIGHSSSCRKITVVGSALALIDLRELLPNPPQPPERPRSRPCMTSPRYADSSLTDFPPSAEWSLLPPYCRRATKQRRPPLAPRSRPTSSFCVAHPAREIPKCQYWLLPVAMRSPGCRAAATPRATCRSDPTRHVSRRCRPPIPEKRALRQRKDC